jgi:hypothetical protein
LDYLDWTFYSDEALNMSVEARQMRWNEQSKTDSQNDNLLDVESRAKLPELCSVEERGE